MRLSKKDLKALAREARKLAFQIVEGTAPRLVSHDWCFCAIGTVIKRAGCAINGKVLPLAYHLDELVSEYPAGSGLGLVSLGALIQEQHPGAPTFPLLALGDALDEAAGRARRKPPSKAVLEEL